MFPNKLLLIWTALTLGATMAMPHLTRAQANPNVNRQIEGGKNFTNPAVEKLKTSVPQLFKACCLRIVPPGRPTDRHSSIYSPGASVTMEVGIMGSGVPQRSVTVKLKAIGPSIPGLPVSIEIPPGGPPYTSFSVEAPAMTDVTEFSVTAYVSDENEITKHARFTVDPCDQPPQCFSGR